MIDLGSQLAAVLLASERAMKKPKPGPQLRSNPALRAFKHLMKASKRDLDESRRAAERTAKLRGVFEKEGRQQTRRLAFELAVLDVNEKYPAEPRRARRRIARATAKRTLAERKAA